MIELKEKVSSIQAIHEDDPVIAEAMEQELYRQRYTLEMIASENFTFASVMQAQGSWMTNKTTEGLPNKRYYGGCEYVDIIEQLAIDRAKEVFGAEHANVQCHSGATANNATYLAFLNPGDRVMGMTLSHGGHLSHGASFNISGKLYDFKKYSLNKETEEIDYDLLLEEAKAFKPKMIVAGGSAYPRIIDFKRFRKIADEVGALLMVDMSHIAGLVAAGVHPNPTPYADVVTSTTTKTLCGGRGAFILCKKEYAQKVDKAVFPGVQGSTHLHNIAAKAIVFQIAKTEKYKAFQAQVVKNAQCLGVYLKKEGFKLVAEGTDTHLILVDLRDKNLTGKQAQEALEDAGITVNKNSIPYDEQPSMITSGIRIATSALTARGFQETEMKQVAQMIVDVLSDPENSMMKDLIKRQIFHLCTKYPLYANL